MTRACAHGSIGAMNTAPSSSIRKYVLVPLPRTDARPRRFALVASDWLERAPSRTAAPESGRIRGRL